MSIILNETTTQDQPGYFRLGFVVLQIPPDNITTHKVENNEEIIPLRAPFPFFKKTGHSSWDVSVRWKAVVDRTSTNPYRQWYDLQNIIAIFKAAPFVEIENNHIRQILLKEDPTYTNARMAFALRQLRVDTHPDIVDALEVNLVMTLFNYTPFSKNFGYLGFTADGKSVTQSQVSADNCFTFRNYIQQWINENIDEPYSKDRYDETPIWTSQDAGTMLLKWRDYVGIPLTPGYNNNGQAASPGAALSAPAYTGNLSGIRYGHFHINPNDTNTIMGLQKAIMVGEHGTANLTPAIYFQVSETNACGLMQWIASSARDTLINMGIGNKYLVAALNCGAMRHDNTGYHWNNYPSAYVGFMVGTNGKLLGNKPWPGTPDPKAVAAITDSERQDMQNQMATTWMTMLLKAHNYDAYTTLRNQMGEEEHPWVLQKDGSYAYASDYYRAHPTYPPIWWNTVVTNFRKFINNQDAMKADPVIVADHTPVADPTASVKAATPVAAHVPTSTGVISGPQPTEIAYVSNLITGQGWIPDHKTDFMAFLYKTKQILLVDEEHIDSIPTGEPIDLDMWPTQISVVFVNNITTMPLENYSYPTFQHIGPAGTQISVNFLAKSSVNSSDIEPEYETVSKLSGMLATLNKQYFNLHHEWRSSSSVQRMQSCVIQNQVLNMLGIRSVIPTNLVTQTMDESPSTIQVSLTAAQYENTFEDRGPFKVKGISSLQKSIWLKLLRSNIGILADLQKNATTDEAGVLEPLFKLSTAMSSRDESTILSWLLDDGYMTNVSSVQVFPSIPVVELNAALSSKNVTWQALQGVLKQVLSSSSKRVTVATPMPGALLTSTTAPFDDDILGTMLTHQDLSYTDYFIISRTMHSPQLNAYRSEVDDALKTIPSTNQGSYLNLMDALYNAYYDYLVGPGAKGFSNSLIVAMTHVEQNPDPTIQNIFNNAINPKGPSSDTPNQEHGAYRDIGIRNMSLGGTDNTPGFYFYDDSRDTKDYLRENIAASVDKAIQTTTTFDIGKFRPQADQGKIDSVNKPGVVLNTGSVSLGDQSNTVPGKIQDILSRINIPVRNMVRAFPTFKLFLMEESSQGLFYMMDDFYSYSNILEIEVIRYRDKPDDAVFVITNMSHLLSHKLFDNTVAGRRELQDSWIPTTPTTSSSSAVSGPTGTADLTQSQLAPFSNIKDLRDSFEKNPSLMAPPRYFGMQTGTKVQIRMGYANNPDLLFPVFTGMITDIQGDEILTVTAQSFMLELMDNVTTKATGTGFEPITSATSPGAYQLTSPGFSGTTETIMSAMLSSPNAKHFGHWQVGENPDSYLKGFTWEHALADALIGWGTTATIIGSLFKGTYNRRDENILVNHLINVTNDTSENNTVRPSSYEQAFNAKANYTIPDNDAVTPWVVIQDIARRYPEYILAVKTYGFPYGADATLVYADPNDWYIARQQLPGNSDVLRAANVSPDAFNKWWTLRGKDHFLGFAGSDQKQITSKMTGYAYAILIGPTSQAGTSYLDQLKNNMNSVSRGTAGALFRLADSTPVPMSNMLAIEMANRITAGGSTVFDAICDAYISTTVPTGNLGAQLFNILTIQLPGELVAMGLGRATVMEEVRKGVLSLQKDLNAFIKQAPLTGDTSLISDRYKPVRKWHYIDESVIIHNGIELNEEIYNAVKLVDVVYPANNNIVSYHQRILNIDNSIVSPKNVGFWQSDQIPWAYAQSFLKEELGKMYRGELIILGTPEIEPNDVIILHDVWSSMVGPIEVDSVIQSFTQETGWISIIKPRALIASNDRATAPALVGLGDLLGGLNYRIGTAGDNSPVLNDPKSQIGFNVLGLKAGVTGVALLLGAVYWAISACIFHKGVSRNIMQICPLSRFNRPWVGGLQGWSVTDMIGSWQQSAVRLWESEFDPLLESYMRTKNLVIDPIT